MSAHALRRRFARWPRLALSLAALAAGAFLVLPLYVGPACGLAWRFLEAHGLPNPLAAMPVGTFLLFYTYPPSLLLSEPTRAAAVFGLTLALALAALPLGLRGHLVRTLEALIVLAILALPWSNGYQAAVTAAPGYELLVVTQPGRVEGVVKRMQTVAEVRPCTYTLLGWAADGTLYYRAETPGRPAETWAFAPGQDARAWLASGPPARLETVEAQPPALERLRGEPGTLSVVVRGKGLASPDGHWVAVVARHVYGPEDVIAIGSSAPSGATAQGG